MIYINTTYQGIDCTVFAVSMQATANDWAALLSNEFDDPFFVNDTACESVLVDTAPHLYAKYRRHVLYNTDDTGMSKPRLVVLEGGRQ